MRSLTLEAPAPVVGAQIEQPDFFACCILGHFMHLSQSVDLHASSGLILKMDGQSDLGFDDPCDLPPSVERLEVDLIRYVDPPNRSGLHVCAT